MGELKITYTDNSGDTVAVSGDEDLLAAYNWAANQPTATIKLSVDHLANDDIVDKMEQLTITQPEEPLVQVESEGTMQAKNLFAGSSNVEHQERKHLRRGCFRGMRGFKGMRGGRFGGPPGNFGTQGRFGGPGLHQQLKRILCQQGVCGPRFGRFSPRHGMNGR